MNKKFSMRYLALVVVFLISVYGNGNTYAQCNIISTVAGNRSSGYSGDGSAATDAELYNPFAVAVDSSGNLFIADQNNNRIRKVNTAGIISTVVGNGTPGFSGDGGPATAAELNNPCGIAVDIAGNLYIADYYNSCIRKVSTTGMMSTIAGNDSTYGYSGDGGAATAAELWHPHGVALDTSGNLYIADDANNRVRKVTVAGIISTIAGNGTAGFSGDDGVATNAELSYPFGVTIDAGGSIYIADWGNNRIRKVNTAGVISTFAGDGTSGHGGDGGPATSGQLELPYSVAIDASGNLYIPQVSGVRKVNASGIISLFAGNDTAGYRGDGGPATGAELEVPIGVAVDRHGNLFIADDEATTQCVRKISVAPPAVSSISGAATLCAGASITVADTTSGGTWSVSSAAIATISSGGSIAGIAPGYDTIKYSVTNGCGTTTVTDVITVNSLPYSGVITGTDSVCPGSTITLMDSVPGGTWLSSASAIATVAPTGNVTGVVSGTAMISYIMSNMCGSDTSYRIINVRSHSSCMLESGNLATSREDISIFPNPNKGSFIINVSSQKEEEVYIVITNLFGQKVRAMSIAAGANKNEEINMQMVPGIYFLSAIIDGHRNIGKIIVE